MREEHQVAIFMVIVMFLWALAAYFGHAKGATFPDKYDASIKEAADKWWKDYPDWKFWKAQLYQESALDPSARSSVGAEGLAQFMPGTWSDIERALYAGATVSRSLAGPAINGGAFYMSGLRRSWSGARPLDDRHRLAQAAYNAGTGNILKAQRLCVGSMLWADISPCMAKVTGAVNAKQTMDYVTRIAHWRSLMQ